MQREQLGDMEQSGDVTGSGRSGTAVQVLVERVSPLCVSKQVSSALLRWALSKEEPSGVLYLLVDVSLCRESNWVT